MNRGIMIVAAELMTALIVAGTLSFFLSRHFQRRGNRAGFFWYFLIIFMVAWAAGAWLLPFGPTLMGIHWVPFVGAGLAGAAVVFLLAGRRYPTNRHETIDLLERVEKERELEWMTNLSLKVLFWTVLLLLLAAVFFRYVLG